MSVVNNTLLTDLEEISSEQFNENNTSDTDADTESVTYPFSQEFNAIMDKIDINKNNLDVTNSTLVYKRRPLERSSSYIAIKESVYDYLVTNGNQGYAKIIAGGGGYVYWYLCHRNENYYFLYRSVNNGHLSGHLSGHLTSVDDINSLRLSYYV